MKVHRHSWIPASVWLGCWLGGWIVEGLIFPNSYGAIGATLGFFGGAYLGARVESYLQQKIQK
jgi:hypothetical protein